MAVTWKLSEIEQPRDKLDALALAKLHKLNSRPFRVSPTAHLLEVALGEGWHDLPEPVAEELYDHLAPLWSPRPLRRHRRYLTAALKVAGELPFSLEDFERASPKRAGEMLVDAADVALVELDVGYPPSLVRQNL